MNITTNHVKATNISFGRFPHMPKQLAEETALFLQKELENSDIFIKKNKEKRKIKLPTLYFWSEEGYPPRIKTLGFKVPTLNNIDIKVDIDKNGIKTSIIKIYDKIIKDKIKKTIVISENNN